MKELNESPHKAFFLTKSNYVFLLVYITVLLILIISFHEVNGYTVGRALGKVVGTAVLSYLLGYICWLISRKNKRVGEWGFNFIVVFIIGTILTTYYNAYQVNQVNQEVQKSQNALYEMLKEDDFSPKMYTKAYSQFSDSLFSGIDKQINHLEGIDKEVLLVIQKYLKEVNEITQKWHADLDKFMAKDVLDPSMLKTDPVVYKNRLNIIHNLLQSTIGYKAMMMQMENEITMRLQPLGLSADRLSQTVKEFMHSPSVTIEQIEAYSDACIAYLDQTRKVLNMMHFNQDLWYLEGIYLVSDDDEFIMGYNHAIENQWQKLSQVDALYSEIFLQPKPQ